MAELVFGLLFTVLPIVFCLGVNYSGEVTVNDVDMTSAEFFDSGSFLMLLPFFIIGVFFLTKSLIKLWKDGQTNIHGIETFAIMTRVIETGLYINDQPVFKGEYAVVVDGVIKMFTESLGTSWKHGDPGHCLIVNQYKNDINVIDTIAFECIPPEMQELLKPYHTGDSTNRFEGYL